MEGLRRWRMTFFVFLILIVCGWPAYAEPLWDGVGETETAQMGEPLMEVPDLAEEPYWLNDELVKEMNSWLENTGLPGPMPKDAASNVVTEAIDPNTASVFGELSNAPGDATVYLAQGQFGPAKIPGGYKSNIMESSLATAGRYVVYTGNWFAARTTCCGGVNVAQWQFINPYSDFPSFCCDQVVQYDEARNRHIWLRMGNRGINPITGNYENQFKLSISRDGMASFWTYTFAPINTNGAWTNQWWDYPHMQLGTDYLYISWNMFNQAGSWTRTVVLRFPLDALANAQGFSYNYFDVTDWFTIVPAQGAYHRMYFASNWPTNPFASNQIRIWSWNEDTTSFSWVTKTVATWTPTGRGSATCGVGRNWAARYDQRVLAMSRYSIMNNNLKIPGRKVLGVWWNVAQGGSFSSPYIDAAAFYEDDLSQVAGGQGRPYIWNPSTCFAYPSVAANKRQDLAIVFNYSGGARAAPWTGYGLSDDLTAAPPGWTIYSARSSFYLPSDNVWGDYNTCRVFEPGQKTWVAGSHYIPNTGGDCSGCAEPFYFVFGRERDYENYNHWRTVWGP